MNNLLTYYIPRYYSYILTFVGAVLIVCTTLLVPGGQTQPEQARSADSFVDFIGVAVHLNYVDTVYGKYDSIIKPRLQELGVRHIRDGFSLEDLSTQEKFKDLARVGIKSTLIMDPRWQRNPSTVVEIAKSVPASAEAVEGPNEWDVWNNLTYNGQPFPTGIRNFQAELYAALKGDPATAHLDVLGPSIALWWNAAKLGNVPCDFGTMHSYAGGGTPTEGLDDKWIPAAQLVCGNKLIVATESGWHTAMNDDTASQRGVSEQAVRKYVPRLYLEYFNRGIKRAFIYELIDLWSDPKQESNFGLLHNSGAPKPSFTALKNLILLLKAPGESSLSPQFLDYTLSGNTTHVHHTLLQKQDGRFYLILWLEVPSFNLQNKTDIAVPTQEVTLNLNTPIQVATTYQPIASTTPIQQYASPQELSLRVPDHPLVIELVPARSQ
jgi:hypothetical protein